MVRGYGAATLSVLALLVAGCQPDTSGSIDSKASLFGPVQVEQTRIVDADDKVLIDVDEIPSSMAVDADTDFSVSGQFVDAKPSSDGRWLALVTVGVAHSGGWVKSMADDSVWPAAFQYGGELRIGPWSDDGQFLAFINHGPAGGQTLSVTVIDQLGDVLEQAVVPVRQDGDNDRPPDERADEPVEWQQGRLLIRRGDDYWRFDPQRREAVTNG